MVSVSQQTILIIVISVIFAGIYGILIWLILVQQGKLEVCQTNQSVFCPAILCNGNIEKNNEKAIEGGKPSNICFPYAYRLTSPDAKNEIGETRFQCNFPMDGNVYISN